MDRLMIQKIILGQEFASLSEEIAEVEKWVSELEFIWKPKILEGSEKIGLLNDFQKACYVLIQTYRELSSTSDLCQLALKDANEKYECAYLKSIFLMRALAFEEILFDSIFRIIRQENGRYYYIGYNFNLFVAEVQNNQQETYRKRLDESLHLYTDDEDDDFIDLFFYNAGDFIDWQ